MLVIDSSVRIARSRNLETAAVGKLRSLEDRESRGHGSTVRKTIAMIIATFCIEARPTPLHADRDFDPIAVHLGLIVA